MRERARERARARERYLEFPESERVRARDQRPESGVEVIESSTNKQHSLSASKRARRGARDRESERERVRESEGMCVCVCVCALPSSQLRCRVYTGTHRKSLGDNVREKMPGNKYGKGGGAQGISKNKPQRIKKSQGLADIIVFRKGLGSCQVLERVGRRVVIS